MKQSTYIYIFIAVLSLSGLVYLTVRHQVVHTERSAINHVSPVVSPNKAYVATISIIKKDKDGFFDWWKITITDATGKPMFANEDDFPARFNIYWLWDSNNRLWIYNSDDGKIYFWKLVDSVWEKNYYNQTGDIKVPDDLVPAHYP